MPTNIGQRLMKVFTLVNSGDITSLPAFCDDGRFDCNFMIPAYAYSGDDDLKNDKFSFLIMGKDWTTDIEFIIQKNVANVWTDQATITDDTYGEYYAMGYFSSKTKYSGVVIYWKDVLLAFGAGEYRIKSTEINPLGEDILYSKTSCLKEWVCTPENTVRLEWYNNKGIGDIDNDRNVLDFSDLNWYNQVRIPSSVFGYPKSTYEEEEIQYQNGQRQDVTSIQEETYTLQLGPIPAWLHNIIKTLAFQSGTLEITDYSPNNPQELIKKSVKRTSAYEPRWIKGSKCAPVTVELKPTYNRLEIDRCYSSSSSGFES